MAQAPVRPVIPPSRATGRKRCKNHKERIKRYCDKCKAPVCIDCIPEHPQPNHNVCKIDDEGVIKSVEKRLIQIFEKVNTFLMEKLQNAFRDLQKRRDMSRSLADEMVDEIIRRNNELKAELDVIKEKLVEKVESCQREYERNLNATEEILEDIRSDIVDMNRQTSEALETGSKIDVLQTEYELRPRCREMPVLPEVPSLKSAKFLSSSEYQKKLERIFGSVQEPPSCTRSVGGDISLLQFVPCSEEPVDAIVALNDQAWVHEDGTTTMKLISVEPESSVVMEVDLEMDIEDMAVSKNGDIFVTSASDQCIRVVRGTTGDVFLFGEDKLDLIPKGLCIRSEKVVVCMIEADDDCPTAGSQRLLQIFDLHGRTKKIIEYYNNERLFVKPSKVTANKNGNFCVVDTGKIVIVHRDGQLIDKYSSQGSDQVFEPEYIICNEDGNLLVADSNNAIHMLDPVGQFLRIIEIQDTNIGDIYSLARGVAGSNVLWIGCENGIAIFSLTDGTVNEVSSAGDYDH